MPGKTKKEKYDKIKEKKVTTSLQDLMRGCPPELRQYMDYCRALKFTDRPDYKKLRTYFQDAFERLGFDHDYYYDWILKKHNLTGNSGGLPKSSVRGPLNRPKEVKLDYYQDA